ncbi:anti-sigma regulatory factor (Ser/Thr protein kinase) [Allocatelliglobosispora scoriae]|uniref:Anti-sigma regulatory factor (Ser/Thr protein kinase) n=1 Tax=Allocatelliglobosispora scoriae TaxID=643052 RepID=A0A841BW61_9ACTN|nr:ATP-binding protein [Allocatelliglobosispora scoriae]MBB5871736.1 anti-sigma regulatory factor (Ser/Thr protein kinase) [Allocatelliglobosispora scoriae]
MTAADQPSSRESATEAGLVEEFDATGLYALRAAVGAHATQLGMGEEQLGKLLIIATELATNAIRHGGGKGRLRLWREGGALHCEVSDAGPGISDPDQVGTRPVPLNVDGGRGLWIVRQFADKVAVTNRSPGTTIHATLHL